MAQKYRLQALLTVKERMKKRAELLLAQAIRRLMEERKTLTRLEEERDEIVERWKAARAEMTGTIGGGPTVGEGNRHVDYLRALKDDQTAKEEEIEDQKIAVEEAEAEVVRARRDYIDAAKELQIMEKHKELWERSEERRVGEECRSR